MRGTRAPSVTSVLALGIIPAYAGNTSRMIKSAEGIWDHPRVCGEHILHHLSVSHAQGSSPRMRGTPVHCTFPLLVEGIIPAYAGNTGIQNVGQFAVWDHPRVCGEHWACRLFSGVLPGSSPRMRGTPDSLHMSDLSIGIIPAYAGNTTLSMASMSAFSDHPRVCGEHARFNAFGTLSAGSSPRMRGTRPKPYPLPHQARDHPRVCGEHDDMPLHCDELTGSSPRMRGTH